MRYPLLPVRVHELPFVTTDGAVCRRLIALGVLRVALCADETLHASPHSPFSASDQPPQMVRPRSRGFLKLVPEPFERARAEIEFMSGLLVGVAAQARPKIHGVGARGRQGFLLGDLKRLRRSARACERWQP